MCEDIYGNIVKHTGNMVMTHGDLEFDQSKVDRSPDRIHNDIWNDAWTSNDLNN